MLFLRGGYSIIQHPRGEQEDQALTEMETLGLPIHLSELDVNNAQGGQRNTGADIVTVSPKPAFDAVIRVATGQQPNSK